MPIYRARAFLNFVYSHLSYSSCIYGRKIIIEIGKYRLYKSKRRILVPLERKTATTDADHSNLKHVQYVRESIGILKKKKKKLNLV